MYPSLLEYQNTIIDTIATPVQFTPKQFTPKTIDPTDVNEQLKRKQLTCKQYYDKGFKPLRELDGNDLVLMQAYNHWIPAIVMDKVKTPHSYIVKTRGGQIYRQNCCHLKRSFTQGGMSECFTLPVLSEEPHNNHQSNKTVTSPVNLPQSVTSSG